MEYWKSFLTKIFNYINKSSITDSLCCAKSFYKDKLNIEKLVSKRFGIDVEIASQLMNTNKKIDEVILHYSRRNKHQGKKLKMLDGFYILKRILLND